MVDFQSPEEWQSPSRLQHAKSLLYNGTGHGPTVVEAALHPPLQWFFIWDDDGYRYCHAGASTIPHKKVPCREWENQKLVCHICRFRRNHRYDFVLPEGGYRAPVQILLSFRALVSWTEPGYPTKALMKRPSHHCSCMNGKSFLLR